MYKGFANAGSTWYTKITEILRESTNMLLNKLSREIDGLEAGREAVGLMAGMGCVLFTIVGIILAFTGDIEATFAWVGVGVGFLLIAGVMRAIMKARLDKKIDRYNARLDLELATVYHQFR